MTEKQREAHQVRVRIARDIHDDIGSGLTKITLLSDITRKKTTDSSVSDALGKVMEYSKGEYFAQRNSMGDSSRK
ncbi:MAG: hypothetical protein IPJ26_17310 [Bacteroidetes bacterium]|nr:hypothetical protein [Bacteroidota bacterium]